MLPGCPAPGAWTPALWMRGAMGIGRIRGWHWPRQPAGLDRFKLDSRLTVSYDCSRTSSDSTQLRVGKTGPTNMAIINPVQLRYKAENGPTRHSFFILSNPLPLHLTLWLRIPHPPTPQLGASIMGLAIVVIFHMLYISLSHRSSLPTHL